MKIGLVCEGGGMKCAYGAGVLDKFYDDHISFDYCVGVSAGSANLASYLAGQRGRNYRFYTKWLKDPEFYGKKAFLHSGDLFGLEYIYGTLTNSDGKDPIDYSAIQKNPAQFELVATKAVSGQPVYLDKSIMKQDDYRAIMASSAIPAACHPIKINGQAYYDGGVSDALPCKRALEQGCDKLVVITSKPRDFQKEPEAHKKLYTLMCHKYPKIVEALDHRHEMYAQQQAFLYQLEKAGKLLSLRQVSIYQRLQLTCRFGIMIIYTTSVCTIMRNKEKRFMNSWQGDLPFFVSKLIATNKFVRIAL